ncbi:chymotrypsin-1-like [Diachasmimorpha longicaudata]|uniref:chymotrypsin-1-like n=1 Tax=Diachasmimorpha longicaudata TaxID=58733 RepID=UPI0030B9028B
MIVLSLLVGWLALVEGASLSARVIGGLDAPDHKYPYMVSLRRRYPSGRPDFHFCGGAILDKHWILTAAHCVQGNLSIAYAVAGTNYLSDAGESYKVWFKITHPDYNNFLHDDIALVRIKGSIEFNKHVQPVKLPSRSSKISSSSAVFAGWGRKMIAGTSSNALQEISLKIISNDFCNLYFGGITERHTCTFNRADEGMCFGDSGSALVADGVQIGIASFVRPCAVGYPDVFTRVSKYVDWIKEVQDKYALILPD